jgi:hypothetical protein
MVKVKSARTREWAALVGTGEQVDEPDDRHIETILSDGFAHTQESRRGRR